jgi:peptidoglycan L-alanyl-D-glutamate endopeptidase CwlK
MAELSPVSLSRLATCHVDLQRIAHEAIKRVDFTVLCGHRGEEEQHAAFAAKTSQLDWPRSRHNSYPAEAVDLAPVPLDWNDKESFRALATYIKEVAAELGVPLTWGGDWGWDLPHFELVRHPLA